MTIREASVLQMEDDYIEMELTSSSSSFKIYSYSINSPQETREFEFQIISVSGATDAGTSPADQLFYKGKLLPLHLPPRLQMVEKLLQNSKLDLEKTLDSTIFEASEDSSPDSPPASHRVSSELNPDEEIFWFQKPSQKKAGLGQKLKAPREYVKSLFNKIARFNEISAEKSMNQIVKIEKAEIAKAIQRASHSSSSSSASSSLSSSFALSATGLGDLHELRRCSSENSEEENSIEGAIAHCKQSHLKMEIGAQIQKHVETSLPSDSKVVKLCNEKDNLSV